MTITNKAITIFGHENPITITIAVLEEQGKVALAEELFKEVTRDMEDDHEEHFEQLAAELNEVDEFDFDEVGFDHYCGCYTGDC